MVSLALIVKKIFSKAVKENGTILKGIDVFYGIHSLILGYQVIS